MQAAESVDRSSERERLFRWTDPRVVALAGRELSGLEALRKIASGELPPPPIAVMMDFDIDDVEEGRVVFSALPGEHLYNPIGMIHGGFACTLLDTVMGCAIHSKLAVGVGYGTTDIHVRMVRPITLATGRVVAEGRVVHLGRTIATAEGTIVDGNGKLLATGTTACAITAPR